MIKTIVRLKLMEYFFKIASVNQKLHQISLLFKNDPFFKIFFLTWIDRERLKMICKTLFFWDTGAIFSNH